MADPDPSERCAVDEACDRLRKLFDAEAARDVRAVYELELTGPQGGTLAARIDDGRLDVAPGPAASPDLRLRLAAEDFLAILAGRSNADMLFMEDRIGWSGELSLALKMRRLFRGQPEERRTR